MVETFSGKAAVEGICRWVLIGQPFSPAIDNLLHFLHILMALETQVSWFLLNATPAYLLPFNHIRPRNLQTSRNGETHREPYWLSLIKMEAWVLEVARLMVLILKNYWSMQAPPHRLM